MVTGLRVKWPGTTTAVWRPCSRDQAELKFLEMLQQFGAWFTDPVNPVAVAEFGEDVKGEFRMTEVIDVAKYLPARPQPETPAPEPPMSAPE